VKAKIRKIIKSEAGMSALIMVLLLVVLGGLILPPLLSFMGTGLKSGQLIERKTAEYYAANGGVDDAMWRIRTDNMTSWLTAVNWGESVYSHQSYSYPLLAELNDKSVAVSILPKWVLEGLEISKSPQWRNPADNITVSGNYLGKSPNNNNGRYQIIILNSISALKVKRIGVWLPAGSSYVTGSCNLTLGGQVFNPTITNFRGGTALTWDYPSPNYIDYTALPPQTGNRRVITFEFTPNQSPMGVFCWIKTNNTANELCWNTDLKVFQITSIATSHTGENITITAFTTKKEFQKYGSVMEGDYYATGNTLMRDTNSSVNQNRDRLYQNTWYTVSSIPSSAIVEKIFLYWTGWKCKPWYASGVTPSTVQQKGIDKVALKVDVAGVQLSANITAILENIQVLPNGSAHGWSYSCFADITNTVKDFFKVRNVSFIGNGKYTVGHYNVRSTSTSTYRYAVYGYGENLTYPYSSESIIGYTPYPLGSTRDGNQSDTIGTNYYEDSGSQDEWAHSAWSIIIVYTSPTTKGHQIYMYDDFAYLQNGTITKSITGFLTPELTDEADAAKLTCFVGEGDSIYTGDSISVNGSYLSDADNPSTNVWNSVSRIAGTLISGIDIDTFNISKTIIKPGDSEATVVMHTDTDAWNWIYMILSFRSKITSGGIMMFDIR
jgi:hypothetical protein